MRLARSISAPLRWWGLAGFFVALGGFILLGAKLTSTHHINPLVTADRPASVRTNGENSPPGTDTRKLQSHLLDLDLEMAVARASFRPKQPSRLAIEAEHTAFEKSHPGLRDSAFWDLVAQR